MNDKVSIIIPIYNVSRYLEDCINSVINQTYKNLEIILVNDGSSDNSLEICNNFKKKDSRIILINKENGGLSSARNSGIDKATGKYLYFLDGDDFLELDAIEFVMNLIKNNNADIASFGYYYYYKDNSIRNRMEKVKNDYELYMNSEEALIQILNRRISFSWMAWNKLYKKELFNDVRFPLGKLYEDLGTTYKLIQKSSVIVYSSVPKYNYVQNPKSITNTFVFNNRELNRIEMCDDMYLGIKENTQNKELLHKLEIFRISQYVSVVNVMIRSNTYDYTLIKHIKKMCRDNFMNSIILGNKKQKLQYSLLALNFKLYRLIFKIFIK
ncbi:glycosyltransferase family 2 protein [Clostridium perfringens]|uniref:glycosyltransferase family 2 protein n=1 Tax=Clostridium perfringens TaxID=1502 RepID=UPI001C84D9C9|nr:glycosyltransferase family 2 protein [Clostridium perfringens]